MFTTISKRALSLPEVVFHIVEFLEFSDLCVVAQVSRLWHQAAASFLPSGDLAWDDNPTWSDDWRSMDLKGRDIVVAELLNTKRPRSLTCDFKEFQGKAIYTSQYQDFQKEAWQAIQDPLVSGHSQLYHLNSADFSFTYPILMTATRLHRLTLRTKHDVSKLSQILNLPNLQQSLRVLSLTECWWSRTGLPFPNKMQFRLTRLDFDRVAINDMDLKRVLEGCPELRSHTALDVMTCWSVPLLSHLSTHNPQLKAFRFSCKPSSSSTGEVDDAQLGWLVANLEHDLRTLGLYRLNVSSDSWQSFLERFGNLTRLELLGKNHASCGLLVHKYLEQSAGLEHLVAENVYIPVYLVCGKESKWACRGLKTLEVGFGPGHAECVEPENQGNAVFESRILFEFLARNVPIVERLLIKRTCGSY